MTRDRLKELWPVMEAWKDGKVIQFRTPSRPAWEDVGANVSLFWIDDFEYRVKPKPREWWLNVYPRDSTAWAHSNREEADREAFKTRLECIHVVEVEP